MTLFALVILACTANGDCHAQKVEHGLTRIECSAKLLHADPKLSCEKENRVTVQPSRMAALDMR
jgi:hypothetical protein